MDLTQLFYFKTIVDERSLTRAAERLYVTQPALSKAISRLEEEFDGPLFVRRGRQIMVNAYGEMLYDWTCHILAGYDVLRHDIRSRRKQESNTLTVAISGTYFSSSIVLDFIARHPNYHLDEVYFKRSEFPSIIYQNGIDCVISCCNFEADGINSYQIYSEPLYLIVPQNHRLARRQSVQLHEIAEERLLFPGEDNLYINTLEDIYRSAGIELNYSTGLIREHTINAVNSGLGVMVVAECALGTFSGGKTRAIPLKDSFCRRDISLLWQSRGTPSPQLTAFIDHVHRYSEKEQLSSN